LNKDENYFKRKLRASWNISYLKYFWFELAMRGRAIA
jgi:hypothetical protein